MLLNLLYSLSKSIWTENKILYPFKLKTVDHIIDLNIVQISDVPKY